MRIRVVSHYLGLILVGLGAVMCIPMATSIFYRESDTIPFIISIGITVAAGVLLRLFGQSPEEKLSRREALLLVAAAWVTAAVFGALPYRLSGVFPQYLDAYFEAMSGFTTTGASVLTGIETQPHGVLLWRDLTQWLGGMGIVMLFVAVFPVIGVGATYMVEGELPGPLSKRLTARIRDTARILWQLYIGLTILAVLALLAAGVPFFDALLTTLGTMPTGGFSPRDMSIAAYNSALVEGIIVFFMVIAGTNFHLFYLALWKRRLRTIFTDVEWRWYVGILIVSVLIVMIDLLVNMQYSIGSAARYSVFQVVAVQTSTGFSTADFALWPSLSKSVLLILMVIGASACSTGGGLKVIRIAVLVKYIHRQILSFLNPRAVHPVKLAGDVLPERVGLEIIGLSVLYFVALALGFLCMSAVGLDTVSALASTAATLGNVGPGLGSVGPAANYASVPDAGKVVLTFCMVIGRLELWTILVLLTPTFWRAR